MKLCAGCFNGIGIWLKIEIFVFNKVSLCLIHGIDSS